MTLEEALIDLGDDPLSKSPFSKTIRAFVNASLGGVLTAPITLDTPGSSILSAVYQVQDTVKQERTLAKALGVVRGKDSYRTLVVAIAVFLVVIGVTMSAAEILDDTPLSHNYGEVVLEIVKGSFGLLEKLLDANKAASADI
jgi:hypothetical protein